jgi:hypothetical protein
MLRKLASVPLLPMLSQTTTKSPAWLEATTGCDWLDVVWVFTWKSPPMGLPMSS